MGGMYGLAFFIIGIAEIMMLYSVFNGSSDNRMKLISSIGVAGDIK